MQRPPPECPERAQNAPIDKNYEYVQIFAPTPPRLPPGWPAVRWPRAGHADEFWLSYGIAQDTPRSHRAPMLIRLRPGHVLACRCLGKLENYLKRPQVVQDAQGFIEDTLAIGAACATWGRPGH